MDEHEFYEHIGEWLLDSKDCQKEDYFLGYTTDPEIRGEHAGKRKPDVVGVQYEWSGNTNGSQDFHHHIVEVKSNVEPRSIDTLIGQIESTRHYVKMGNVAADTASYYMAIPTTNIPPPVQKKASEDGIGILMLDVIGDDEDGVLVREKQAPSPENTERISPLANSEQDAKGNFRRGVEKTAVLDKIIVNTERFFEEEIKKRKYEYIERKNKKKFTQYIDSNNEAQTIAKEILEFLEGINQITVRQRASKIKDKPPISIEVNGERIARLIPQRENLKIKDLDGDLLFRIGSRKNIFSTVESVETVTEAKVWMRENLCDFRRIEQGIDMSKGDSYVLNQVNLDWSEWKPLNAGSLSEVPKEAGLYRIHHRSNKRDHLEYIGESGDTRRRIQSLARGAYADKMPYRDPHTAAPCLWAVRDDVGSALEVSYTTPPKAEDEQHRKGIEAALIALHRRETDRSPTANFGRIIDGYKQSSYSYNDPAYKGGPLKSGEEEPNSASGVEPPDWQNWRDPLARDWMSLDWSEPYRLAERLDADPPDTGVYRIWYEEQDSSITYIGESSNISSRLYNHEQTYGEEALFAYAERSDLDASHKREEIETDLIGAYYLEVGEAPLAQFGHTENIPP